MTNRTSRALALLAVLGALGAGCFGRGVQPSFYALRSGAGPAAGPPLAARADLGLVVGPLEFPRYLDRPEVVTRDGANRLGVSGGSRWGGSLRDDVLRVVADDLGRLLGTAQVVTYPTEPRFPAHYRIALDVREFEGVAAQRVVLRAIWTIADATSGRALAVEETRVEEAVASAASEDLVAAQSAALGAMSRAIALRVDALASRRTQLR
ncbi:MAG: hypothetical protein DCC71_14810 [Proteobacteria bacterium]|nr:MAG: hypothetical protein DCC71_14810 [Pseudomonadota bacterium]